MGYLSTGPDMDRQIRKSFRTTGILLPQAVSIVLSIFIGSLLILSGLADVDE